jgi:hypothetical protein
MPVGVYTCYAEAFHKRYAMHVLVVPNAAAAGMSSFTCLRTVLLQRVMSDSRQLQPIFESTGCALQQLGSCRQEGLVRSLDCSLAPH